MSTMPANALEKFSSRWRQALACAILLVATGSAMGQASRHPAGGFLKGPEDEGQAVAFSGTVIGIRNELDRRCHVIRVDRPDLPRGMGAGGRALLCSSTITLDMGQSWKGQARQTDTGWVRMGPRWRVVPLFEIP